MRKYHQQQILGLLKTIEQAQSERLYADCQAGAVAVGGFIESIEGEGTKTVALLEEYCELLFKANNGEIKEKHLRKHLIKIENSVIDELKPNKIEVVFFPYKVSMWDSLESIYLAAKADPNCDAYVVPIPSYELNPDGTLGKMHYDGDQYPKDIVVVDWQTYDIEARRPDVIFIHYAYDDNVSNATIHPDFYSKRLREYCELLVYSPYFVSPSGTVPDYYGYLPGVLYSHHVIVESETVRQSYIGHYKRFDKEFGWKGKFGKAEEKFLALGSPKFDKIINTKREDCELPDEWERLIYKSDGSRKKVILYNTHMFTWINGGEAYFKKLRSVFDLFQNRDDLVLWWRPHPNTEMNFRVKRPEWLGAYHAVVDDYKRGGWGIYDNTPDLHRAIACSDAYYGDDSSLVALFGTTGKPMMIQRIAYEVRLLYVDERELLFIYAGRQSNIVFSYNCETTYTSVLTILPQNEFFWAVKYPRCLKIADDYYFSPYTSDSIIKYNKKTKTLDTYQLATIAPLPSVQNHRLLLRDIFYFDSYIYFTPVNYPGIVRQSISTGEINVIDDFIIMIKKSKKNIDQSKTSFGLAVRLKNYLVFPIQAFNAIVVFNLQTNTSKIVQMNADKANYQSIACCCDGERVWTLSHNQCAALRWDVENEQCLEFTEFPEKVYVGSNIVQFRDIFHLDGYVFLIAENSNHSYKINTVTDEVTIANELEFNTFIPCSNYITAHAVIGNKVHFVTRMNEWYTVSCSDDQPTKKDIKISGQNRTNLSDILSNDRIIDAHPEFDINEFLDFLISERDTPVVETRTDSKTEGVQIYNYVKDIAGNRFT